MIIYLAGPFRNDLDSNIEKAKVIAANLIDGGYSVVCPHLNSGCLYGQVDEGQVGDMYREIIISLAQAGSTTMLVMEGWEDSTETLFEMQDAYDHGMDIYELDLGSLQARGAKLKIDYTTLDWIKEQPAMRTQS